MKSLSRTDKRLYATQKLLLDENMLFTVRRVDWEIDGAGVRSLRTNVFVKEQGVPEDLEWDHLDAGAIHAVAYDEAWPRDATVIGTGRLIVDSPTTARIGRMAVETAIRRSGIGSAILSFLEEEAQALGIQRITLHAQNYVKDFYRHHGYREHGETFMEAGILHVEMQKSL